MLTSRTLSRHAVVLLSLILFTNLSLAGDWDELQKLLPADRAAQARFGNAVSIDGNYAIIGAYLDATDASGGNMLYGAGAAYIFIRSGDTWVQQQKLVPADRRSQALFGYSVSISGDYAIVGAIYDSHNFLSRDSLFRAGSAYLFERSGTTWTQVRKVSPPDRRSNDNFGVSVGISAGRAIVGGWHQDLNAGGTTSVSDAGAAYIYVRTDTGWASQQKITATAREVGAGFGFSVAISGNRALIGAMDEDPGGLSDAGAAYLFRRADSTWVQEERVVAPDAEGSNEFGWSVALSGDDAVIGAYRAHYDGPGNRVNLAGAIYTFARADTDWVFQQQIFAEYRTNAAGFGHSVAIADSHLIGGCATWRAHMFVRRTGTWTEVRKLVGHDSLMTDGFGFAVAVSNGHAMVGAPNNWLDAAGGNNLPQAGAVYVFGPSPTAIAEPTPGEIPRAFLLHQNFPNPFNPTTTIRYGLPRPEDVRLTVYNALGQEVAVLVHGKQGAGTHEVTFDGSGLASGLYICRLQGGTSPQSRKLMLLR